MLRRQNMLDVKEFERGKGGLRFIPLRGPPYRERMLSVWKLLHIFFSNNNVGLINQFLVAHERGRSPDLPDSDNVRHLRGEKS